MTTATFPELVGQKLNRLWAFDQDNFPSSTNNSLLAGVQAWEFDDALLVFSSSLRHLHCARGSVVGNESGDLCDVGSRVTLLSHESAEAWLSRFVGRTTVDATHWRRLIGQRLNDIRVTPNNANHQQRWRMELAFSEEAQSCSVVYRQDLDGLIETSWGSRFELQQIEVDSPKQAFGWLHPAAPLEFILNEQMWRSAQMSDWPFAIRKQLQTSTQPDAFYRDTLSRALMARFKQHPIYRQRLASWWGPEGFTNELETFEFQVGGRWTFVMVGPDGARYPNQCVFTGLEPASRVVILHDCEPFFTLSVQLTALMTAPCQPYQSNGS